MEVVEGFSVGVSSGSGVWVGIEVGVGIPAIVKAGDTIVVVGVGVGTMGVGAVTIGLDVWLEGTVEAEAFLYSALT
jgi:hypothetical protein